MNNPVAQSKRIYFRPLELEDIKNGWQKWINDSEANEFLMEYIHKQEITY